MSIQDGANPHILTLESLKKLLLHPYVCVEPACAELLLPLFLLQLSSPPLVVVAVVAVVNANND